jgi:Arm DNA-binding domain
MGKGRRPNAARQVERDGRAKKKKPRHYGDGGGLWLQVAKRKTKKAKLGDVTKCWAFRYTSPLTGKPREMGLGSFDTFSVAEARELARQYRQLVAQGIDPLEKRRKERNDAKAAFAERLTLADAAARFHSAHAARWKNKKHQYEWKSSLERYALPSLGNRPVGEITGALITEALAPLWSGKHETARRTKQRVERVLQWVKDGMPLPQPRASSVQHHPALG